ncbi:MAG: DUF3823 domain-containing protein [Tannerella sp.]|nr:DUF3823 domain-containing protein [Tannerella sp.]
MKKIIVWSAIIMMTGVIYSCDLNKLDNYDAPDAQLSGSIIDVETGELVQQDIINGTTIKITEHGYDPVSPQYLRIKNDGTYANTMLFANTYTIQPDIRNFVQVEEQDFKIGKNSVLDFRVQPYIRIKDASIVKEGNNVIATFKLQQTTPNAVSKIGLYAHSEPIVGEPIRSVASEQVINRIVDENESFKVAINVGKYTALLKEGNQYYFRIGALSSFSGAKYNYVPAQRINVGEILPVVEPEGTSLDKCESTDGWAGATLDSDNPQEGNYSVSFSSPGGFIISKNFDPSIKADVGYEYGVLQFDLYISDVSVFDWTWPGQIEITSGGGPDTQELHWNFTSERRLHNGWNKVVLNLSDAEATGGNIDLSAINFFRIYHLVVNGPVVIKLDNLKLYEEF